MNCEQSRYFVWFSYDGSAYHGWQIQPNGISVQAVLQKGISILLRQDIIVVGAGRTDAGVHARQMVAHFDTDVTFDTKELAFRLNRMMPRDISIHRVQQVPSDMHARFSAISRTYHYYLHTQKDPFKRTYSCELHYPLDFQQMNQAASMLLKYNDFGAFCKAGADVKTTICHLTEACWIQDGPTQWHFRITANRFLRNMVRAIVGTLIDVGRDRLTLTDFRQVVERKNRSDAGESMPAHALFLEDVRYEMNIDIL